MDKLTLRAHQTRELIAQMFETIQLAGSYVLYYDEDHSKQQIKNMNSYMREVDMGVGDRPEIEVLEKIIYDKSGIDIVKMAKEIPIRVMIELAKRSNKKLRIAGEIPLACRQAVELYLVEMIPILQKHYKYSVARIEKWWIEILAFLPLYSTGLTDDHIVKYFDQECNLEITKG